MHQHMSHTSEPTTSTTSAPGTGPIGGDIRRKRRARRSRRSAAFLALAAAVLAAPLSARAQAFPEIPTCGQCPPIADDPAKICDGDLRWGFNADPNAKIPDQPSGTPLGEMLKPADHAFELWIFIGGAGLASPSSCMPGTCLYQAIPKGGFTKVREGRFLYQNPSASMGSAQFIKEIDIRMKDGAIHFGIDGYVATPADGKVSLVLSQMGNTVVVGGTPVTEPTVSFGIDRRHDAWKSAACGLRLHDAGGSAPAIFCTPPLASECVQPPPETCTKRRCVFAAEVRQNSNGKATVELHVAVLPSTSASMDSEKLTVTLQRTSTPVMSAEIAKVNPGEMIGNGKRYTLRRTNLRVNSLERKDGLLALDIIGKLSLPAISPLDDLVITISLGPDTFTIPALPGQWSTNANGNPVVKGGPDGLPFCPKDG